MKVISKNIGENQHAKIEVTCMDCGEDFIMNLEGVGLDQVEIKNGAIGVRDEEYLFKCPECWETDKNFGRACDVYSRVAGYLHPVWHWNDAEQAGFNQY